MRKQVYTIQEVAELLRFSEQTVRDWARSGQIKAVRPGLRAWRVPRAEVERLLAQFQIDDRVLDDHSGGEYNPSESRAPMPAPVLKPTG